jgi:hypothetical protein
MVVAALVAGVSFVPAGPAQARATIFRISDTHTETFTGPLEGCLPEDLVGAGTLTETSTGRVVDTGKRVFTVHFVNLFDFHMEFPDGRFVQSGLNRDHFTLVVDPPHSVLHVVTQDLRTIFAADGTVIGSLSIHAGFHLTYTDLNGNDAPNPGEISAGFEHFRLRCR